MDESFLAKAFYYPACNVDLEPLVRFSHLTNLFVYADWHQPREQVIDAFQNLAGQGHLQGLALRDDGREIGKEELGRHTPMPNGFQLTPEQHREYNNRLADAPGYAEPWAREFTFLRQVGTLTRELTLIYVSGEALATYAAMFLSRGVAPQFVCTVQSGPGWGGGWSLLEQPGGVFEQFLLASPAQPRFWIRGGYCMPFAEGESEWGVVRQGYSGWTVVALFGRDEDDLGFQQTVELSGNERTVVLNQTELTRQDLDNFDATFVTKRLARILEAKGDDRVHVFRSPHNHSLMNAMQHVASVSGELGFDRIAMVGVGREDEGQCLREWVDQPGSPHSVEIRFEHELDFADLRSGMAP